MKTGDIPMIRKGWLALVLALLPSIGLAMDQPTVDEQLIQAARLGDLALVKTPKSVASSEKADGTTGQIAEYSFQRDTTNSIANEWSITGGAYG